MFAILFDWIGLNADVVGGITFFGVGGVELAILFVVAGFVDGVVVFFVGVTGAVTVGFEAGAGAFTEGVIT